MIIPTSRNDYAAGFADGYRQGKKDAERKKGKWRWLSSTYDRTPCEMRFECSSCHHETITHNSGPWEKYCPNCGADMRGEEDEI